MIQKWRPSLALVLGGALSGTLALSFAGLIAYRYLGPAIGFRDAAVLLACVIAAATSVLGWMLWRVLLRPMTDLQRFATQSRSAPVDHTMAPVHFGTTELQATAVSVMEMAETLHNRETTIRSFSDHVSHEMKTPVAAIRAATELLQEGSGLTQGDLHLVNQIAGASNQMQDQLQAMQLIVRAREVQYIGSSTLNDLRSKLEVEHSAIDFDIIGSSVLLPLEKKGLGIVLGHLVANAVVHDATRIELKSKALSDRAVLTVTDNGTGISSGNAGRLFEPFFTTRRDQGGTGMGLSIVKNILRAHGADIQHLPTTTGATFCIRFGKSEIR